MIDAIFVQACEVEIANGRLFRFLSQNFFKKVSLPIFIFLDWKSSSKLRQKQLNLFLKEKFPFFYQNIQIIFVMDEDVDNPTTFVFTFMMNFKLNFEKVLVLETDCWVKEYAIDILSEEIAKIKHDWFIYGAYYRGSLAVRDPNHMNGVGIYNRTPNFINFINNALITNYNSKINYDILLNDKAKNNDFYKNKVFDSNYIVNLSPACDAQADYRTIKPKAVVIHQKIY